MAIEFRVPRQPINTAEQNTRRSQRVVHLLIDAGAIELGRGVVTADDASARRTRWLARRQEVIRRLNAAGGEGAGHGLGAENAAACVASSARRNERG